MSASRFPSTSRGAAPGRGSVVTEIFFTPVAQPNPENLRDLLPLRGGESFIEGEGAGSFKPTGTIAMGIPVRPRQTDAADGFFHERRAAEIIITDFSLGGHGVFA